MEGLREREGGVRFKKFYCNDIFQLHCTAPEYAADYSYTRWSGSLSESREHSLRARNLLELPNQDNTPILYYKELSEVLLAATLGAH